MEKIGKVKSISLYQKDGLPVVDKYGNCRFFIKLEDDFQLILAQKNVTQDKYEEGKEYTFTYDDTSFNDKVYHNIKLPKQDFKQFVPQKASLTFEQQLQTQRIQCNSIEAQVALKCAVERAGTDEVNVVSLAKDFYKFLKECREDGNNAIVNKTNIP